MMSVVRRRDRDLHSSRVDPAKLDRPSGEMGTQGSDSP